MNAGPASTAAARLKLALGLGCDRGTPAATIAHAIDQALASVGASRADVVAAASINLKADEAGLLEVAAGAGWTLHFHSPQTLAAVTVLTDLHESIPVILGVAVGVVGAVQVGLRRYAADETTASSAVAEYRDGGDILAGPTNDLVTTGHHVRTIGYDDGPDCD